MQLSGSLGNQTMKQNIFKTLKFQLLAQKKNKLKSPVHFTVSYKLIQMAYLRVNCKFRKILKGSNQSSDCVSAKEWYFLHNQDTSVSV